MAERGEATVLIGFMGSGKSSVGRHLARRLRLPRYDTDQMISSQIGRTIAEIFERDSEEAFRVAETELLREFSQEAAIIVTGGGIVLRPENRVMLRRLGRVVNLAADEETLFERVSRRRTRPLLKTPHPRSTLRELLRAREPLYLAAADFTVDTSALRHEQVADAILARLEELEVNER